MSGSPPPRAAAPAPGTSVATGPHCCQCGRQNLRREDARCDIWVNMASPAERAAGDWSDGGAVQAYRCGCGALTYVPER